MGDLSLIGMNRRSRLRLSGVSCDWNWNNSREDSELASAVVSDLCSMEYKAMNHVRVLRIGLPILMGLTGNW